MSGRSSFAPLKNSSASNILKKFLIEPTFYGLFALLLLYILLSQTPDRGGFDWLFAFRTAARGEPSIIITPYWVNFLSFIPAHLPEPLGYSLWISAGCIAFYIAARWVKAPIWVIMLSYPIHWCLYHGQVDLFLAGAAALGLWSAQKQKPYLAGAAILILLIKPHITVLAAILIFWWLEEKKKAAIVVLAGIASSFILWPGWLESLLSQQIFSYTQRLPLSTWSNTSPHLPIWVSIPLAAVALFSPLEKARKLQAVLAISLLISPYAPVYSQIMLLWFPLPIPIAALAILPWFGSLLQNELYYKLTCLVFPITVILSTYWPYVSRNWVQRPKNQEMEVPCNREPTG